MPEWKPEPDEQGRLFPDYWVTIQRMADGEVRKRKVGVEWHSGSWYWWSEGNFCCDCNRYIEFERAGGRQLQPMDEDVHCGDGGYRVLRFDFPDGTWLDGPDVEEESWQK